MDSEILLHPNVAKRFQQILVSLPHAILLMGPLGSGKDTACAYLLEEMSKSIDLSVHSYDAAEDFGIDEIRGLWQELGRKQLTSSMYRIVLIKQADQLGHASQNALLKQLEEPPQNTIFILMVESAGNILPTITSRLTTLQLLPIPKNIAATYFGMHPTSSDFFKIYNLSEGWPGTMVTLANNESNSIMDDINIAKTVLSQTVAHRIAIVDSIIKSKESTPERILSALIKTCYAAMRNCIDKNTNYDKWLLGVEVLEKAQIDLRAKTNSKIVLTDVFLSL